MAGAVESSWAEDRQRFISRFSQRRDQRGHTVADDRARLWSPLARQFADLGRDLYAVGGLTAALDRVVGVATRVVPGAALASITLARRGGRLHTPSSTHESGVTLDEIQRLHGEGPFWDAVRPNGTGMASSADLAHEQAWPQFGPWAVEEGVRGVVSVAMLPEGDDRLGALNVYAAEPRGLAAVDPDVLLILASFAAAAISGVDAVTADELRAAGDARVVPSPRAMEYATNFLMRKRHLSLGEVYDILRRASGDLIRACRAMS